MSLLALHLNGQAKTTLVLKVFLAVLACAACSDVEPKASQHQLWRGINLSGQRYTPGNQLPVSAAIDYYVSQKKMNLIRINLDWDKLQPHLNGPIDEVQLAGVDEQIRAIISRGATAQIEIHTFGRRTVAGVEHIIGESPDVTAADFASLWRQIAVRWKDNDHVVFELMNEPHDQDVDSLIALQNATIEVIRNTGAKNLVVVSGSDWSHPSWFSERRNQIAARRIVDRLDNIAFAIHHYFDAYSAGQTCDVTSESNKSLRSFTEWARGTGKRGLVGEFAVCTGASGKTAVTQFLNEIERDNDVYLGWTWWAGGGWWKDNYIFLLDPYGSQWDPDNPDRNIALGGTGRATAWASPLPDRPQMGFLQPYLPKEASPFNGTNP